MVYSRRFQALAFVAELAQLLLKLFEFPLFGSNASTQLICSLSEFLLRGLHRLLRFHNAYLMKAVFIDEDLLLEGELVFGWQNFSLNDDLTEC
jgi:hypothetical protein